MPYPEPAPRLHKRIRLLWRRLISFIHQCLRQVTIRRRLTTTLVILAIVPVSIMGVFTFTQTTKDVRDKVSYASIQLLNQVAKNIYYVNQRFESLSDYIMYDSMVQKALVEKEQITSWTQRVVNEHINEMLEKQFEILADIKTLMLFTPDGQVFYDIGYNRFRESDLQALYRQLEAHTASNRSRELWTHVKTINGDNCLVYARPINNMNDWNQRIGYIVVAVDEYLYSTFTYGDVTMGQGSSLFIINTAGKVMSTSDYRLKVGQFYPDPSFKDHLQVDAERLNGVFTMNRSIDSTEVPYLFVYTYSVFNDWFLVGSIPYNYLNEEAWKVQRDFIIICGVLLALSLVITLVISTSITGPLKRLTDETKRVSMGQLDNRIVDKGNDELGFLTHKFNCMVIQIKDLIVRTEEEQRLKREIELQMLQAQINPHFLFNTLNSLKWTAALSQADSVSNGLGALADLLRHTIVDKKELVTLRDEFRQLRNYVTIQKMRYGEFDIIFDVDPGLYDIYVIKFLLQPIVENAIIHGLDTGKAERVIRLSVRQVKVSQCMNTQGATDTAAASKAMKDSSVLQIQVSDNGKGMDEETLRSFFTKQPKSHQRLANIGVHNVLERIRLHYGEPYGMQVMSGLGEGTTVTFCLPLIHYISSAEH